jgi:hypothetical protein
MREVGAPRATSLPASQRCGIHPGAAPGAIFRRLCDRAETRDQSNGGTANFGRAAIVVWLCFDVQAAYGTGVAV